MTHEDVFLQDILDNHSSDLSRRIYADWLLDQNDPVLAARGELIHVQLDLALCPTGSPRPDALLRRERALLEQHGREWGSLYKRIGCNCWEYQRGFVEGVGVPAAAFLAHAAALFRVSPIQELKLYSAGGTLAEVAECPYLARVRILDLEKNELGDGDLEDLASSPHLGAMTTLLLWCNRIGDAGVQALIAAPWANLQRLDMSQNVVGDNGAIALAHSPMLRHLRRLDLAGNHVGDSGAEALARSPFAENLEILELRNNPIGTAGLMTLRERFAHRAHVPG